MTPRGLRRDNKPEYYVWVGMHSRCYRPNHNSYPKYGGRGIRVCDRWLASFADFLEDMGNRPTLAHTIDRIDNDGDYCPENCRWATRREQQANRRIAHKVTHNGRTDVVSEWARTTASNVYTLFSRIRRMGHDKAMQYAGQTLPVGARSHRKTRNRLGYKGVSQVGTRFRSQFEYVVDGKRCRVNLGRYDSAIEAALAYNRKAREVFGEFAILNVIHSEPIGDAI